MDKPFDVAVLVGSLRKDSLNRKIAHALIELAPSSLKPEIVEIGHNRLPDTDPLDVGEDLINLLQDDWDIFSDSVSFDSQHELLSRIINAYTDPKDFGRDVNDLWTHYSRAFTSRTLRDLWLMFALHLRLDRRFIPDFSDSEISDPRDFLTDAVNLVEVRLERGLDL